VINGIAWRVISYVHTCNKTPSGSFRTPWLKRSSVSETSGFGAFDYSIRYRAGVVVYA
jgi:hypothetical protein